MCVIGKPLTDTVEVIDEKTPVVAYRGFMIQPNNGGRGQVFAPLWQPHNPWKSPIAIAHMWPSARSSSNYGNYGLWAFNKLDDVVRQYPSCQVFARVELWSHTVRHELGLRSYKGRIKKYFLTDVFHTGTINPTLYPEAERVLTLEYLER